MNALLNNIDNVNVYLQAGVVKRRRRKGKLVGNTKKIDLYFLNKRLELFKKPQTLNGEVYNFTIRR